MAFPILSRHPSKIERSESFPVNIDETEGNYTLLSRLGTKIPKEFKVIYDEENIIPQSDLDSVLSYIRNNFGLYFDWTDPELENTHNVFYNAKTVDYSSVKYKMGWYRLTLVFKEK